METFVVWANAEDEVMAIKAVIPARIMARPEKDLRIRFMIKALVKLPNITIICLPSMKIVIFASGRRARKTVIHGCNPTYPPGGGIRHPRLPARAGCGKAHHAALYTESGLPVLRHHPSCQRRRTPCLSDARFLKPAPFSRIPGYYCSSMPIPLRNPSTFFSNRVIPSRANR